MIKVPEVKGKIFFNKELAQYTWFNVGGKADVVFEPYDIEDLQHFLNDIDKNILVPGVRMTLNEDYSFTMPIEKWKGFIYNILKI